MSTRETRGAALADYVQMIWERRWLILGLVIVSTAISLVARPPTPTASYRATATLSVQTLTINPDGSVSLSGINAVPPEEIEAARSADTASTSARELGETDGGVDLLNRLTVQGIPSTNLVQLILIGKTTRVTQELETYASNYVTLRKERDTTTLNTAIKDIQSLINQAQATVNTLSRQPASRGTDALIRAWERQLTRLSDVYVTIQQVAAPAFAEGRVKLVSPPIVQHLGALPTRTIRAIAGPLVGLLLGIAIAIALGILRPRIPSRERAEERLGYPVLAAIPHVPPVSRDPLKIQRASAWGAEGVRMLLTEIGLVEKRGRRVRVIVVVSPDSREGRTTIAVNLAASFAAAGRSVALFHADREKPAPATAKSAEFVGQHEIAEVRMHKDGFAEVQPGPDRPQTVGVAKRSGLNDIVQELAGDFDVVIVDTRPVLHSADAVALAAQGDVVLMVLRHLKTMEARAASAIEILERHDAPLAGLVLDDHRLGMIERYRSGRVDRPRTRAIVPAAEPPSDDEPRIATEGPAEAALARRRSESVQRPEAPLEPTPMAQHSAFAEELLLIPEEFPAREATPAGSTPRPDDLTGT
ncbi:MAG: hypothetical protein WAT66_11305 [Actinomycetota bacterium]